MFPTAPNVTVAQVYPQIPRLPGFFAPPLRRIARDLLPIVFLHQIQRVLGHFTDLLPSLGFFRVVKTIRRRHRLAQRAKVLWNAFNRQHPRRVIECRRENERVHRRDFVLVVFAREAAVDTESKRRRRRVRVLRLRGARLLHARRLHVHVQRASRPRMIELDVFATVSK